LNKTPSKGTIPRNLPNRHEIKEGNHRDRREIERKRERVTERERQFTDELS
jgi:hypothetical protein